jgi:hypothetical protein
LVRAIARKGIGRRCNPDPSHKLENVPGGILLGTFSVRPSKGMLLAAAAPRVSCAAFVIARRGPRQPPNALPEYRNCKESEP